jgi:hypothetical protein
MRRSSKWQKARVAVFGLLPVICLAVGGCDFSFTDFAIDDADLGGVGVGGGGGIPLTPYTIRPVATQDTVLISGTGVQLQLLDLQGAPAPGLTVQYGSLDSTVLSVSEGGWAEAHAPGSVTVLASVEGWPVPVNQSFVVVLPPSASGARLGERRTPPER